MINIADAEYTPATLQEHAGNPMIEALPPILEPGKFTASLSYLPRFTPNERDLSDHDRILATHRIGECTVATPSFYSVYERIYTLIKAGYSGKNPLTPTTTRWVYSIGLDQARPKKTTADTLLITGLSGGGKTTTLGSVLRCFPNVIEHTNYQGKAFAFQQIVYVRIDMPSDATRSALCLAILDQFDQALGTDYVKQYSRQGVKIEAMQRAIATIAANHMLGMIFIDEFQNMNIAKSGGKEAALQFFDQMSNIVQVPMIMIGTPAALKVFTGQFRSSRRAGSAGIIEIGRHASDSDEWNHLIKAAWRYQWIKNPTRLSPELKSTLYQLTQGIPFCLFRLMELANRYAISSGQEAIGVDTLKRVYKKEFGLIRDALSALRTGNTQGYEDLMRCEEVLRDMNGGNQLRELMALARSGQFRGEAANHLSAYVEDAIVETELTTRERNELAKLKQKLQERGEIEETQKLIEGSAS